MKDYQKILDAMARAGNGDFNTEISLSTDDPDLVAFAQGFNRMIRKLKSIMDEMRDSNRQWEIKAKRLMKIFDGSRDIIIQINRYGTIVDINKSVKEILGYDPDDLKGKHFAKSGVIVEEEISKLLDRFNIAIKKGLGRDLLELRTRSRNGEILIMEASINLVRVEDEIEGVIVVLRDITRHLQTDARLKEEKEKLKTIVSSIEDVILILNKDGHLVEYYKSPPFQESFVFAKIDDFIGKSIKGILPRSVAGEIDKALQACMKTGKIKQFDYSYPLHKEDLWFNARISPVRNYDNNIVGATIVIRDITQHIGMEKALEQSERKYREIFENSPQGLIILDGEGRITDVNRKLCEWLGYKRQEVIGKDHIMYPFLTKSGKIVAMRKFIQRLSGKFVEPYELEFIARDGTVFVGEIDARPIRDEKGNIVLIVVVITDVTKRH